MTYILSYAARIGCRKSDALSFNTWGHILVYSTVKNVEGTHMKAQAILLSKADAKVIDIEVGEPGRNEVLIQTKACGICMGDIYVYRGKVPGGRVMGHEGVGIVAEVGEDVKNVKVGDKVTTLGGPAFAQYYKANCRSVERIPENVEDLASWISEPAACVVNGIRGSEIEIGDNVCVIGCGYMGLLLVQAMPKNTNCLIALDVQDERLKLAKKFGADHVLNPLKVDPVKEVQDILGGEADIVIEASGAPGTLQLATELVRGGWRKGTMEPVRGGKIVIFGRHVLDEKVPTEKWHTKGIEVLNTAPSSSQDFSKDFHDAVNLFRRGVFDQEPLITHKFSYKDAEKAFKTASEKPTDYMKGVIAF